MKGLYAGIITAMAAFAAPAMAQSQTAEPIESGSYADCNTLYVFTAPSDGVLEISSSTRVPAYLTLYTTPNTDSGTPKQPELMVPGNTGYNYYFNVTGGRDYYFLYDVLEVNDRSRRFLFTFLPEGLTNSVSMVEPAPSTSVMYNLSSAPFIEIAFLMQEAFDCSECVLSYVTTDGATATTPVYYEGFFKDPAYTYEFYIKDAISEVKKNMKDDSEFSLLIKNPKVGGEPVVGPAAYINEDGDLQLTYRYSEQTSIVDVKYPDPFLSYWPEDDESAVITLTFDGELAPMDKQKDLELHIFAGPYVDGGEDSAWPELPGAPMEINGNVLTVPLQGVHRITNLNTVTVRITGLLGKDMMSVDYYGSGAVQITDIPYKKLDKQELGYELNPAAGSLEGVESIELYVYAEVFDHVAIQGFTFTAESIGTVEVSAEEADPVDDVLMPGNIIYTIPVAENVQTAENVVFSVVLRSLDGNDYEITALYNEDSGVDGVASDKADSRYFDLQGREIKNPGRGIYILNGKKLVRTH